MSLPSPLISAFVTTTLLLILVADGAVPKRSVTITPRWPQPNNEVPFNDQPAMDNSGSQESERIDRSIQLPLDANRYGLAPNETLISYAQKNCSQCLAREEAKISRIEQIKRDLLEKLGLNQVPMFNRSELPSIPNVALDGILKNYPGFQGDQPYRYPDYDLDFHAKTERIYVFGKRFQVAAESSSEDVSAEEQQTSPVSPVVIFDFSPTTQSSDVQKATLHFYVRSPQHQLPPHQRQNNHGKEGLMKIQLYRVTDIRTPRSPKMELFETKEIKVPARNRGHWESFGVKKLIAEWFAKPARNYGLYIKAEYKGENLAVYPEMQEANNRYNMYVDMTTAYGAKSRAKRDNQMRVDCSEETQESRCCRYPLVVDFEKFGWDWVIAPKKYFAFYCSGECPYRYLQKYIHTYMVQQTGTGGNAGPCCTPADVAPIQMIYFNGDKEINVSKVPGMIVTRCGCA